MCALVVADDWNSGLPWNRFVDDWNRWLPWSCLMLHGEG